MSECQQIKRVGSTSMALNALVDSFLPQSEKCGTKRVKLGVIMESMKNYLVYGFNGMHLVCLVVSNDPLILDEVKVTINLRYIINFQN